MNGSASKDTYSIRLSCKKDPCAAAAKYCMLAGILFFATTGFSQPYTSRLGRFQVDQKLGCAPFTVTITAANLKPGHDCTSQTCQMTFEPTAPVVQNVFTYTYDTPGTYTLMVLYQSTLVDPSDDIVITVLPNIEPTFNLYTCSGNAVTLAITDKNYDQYFIDYGDGTAVVPIAAGSNPTDQHTYPSSGSYNINVHGRKLNAADDCNSGVKTFKAIAVLPPQFIQTLSALDANNLKLDFIDSMDMLLELQIAVNDAGPFQNVQTLYNISTALVSGLDLTKNYYCFRINVHDPCTGNDTPSNIICSQKFTSTAASDVNLLSWVTQSGVPGFSINRNGILLTTTAGSSYNDAAITCNTQYCYQLISNYANGSTSISLTECVTSFSSKIPDVINNTSSVVSDEGVMLTWLQDTAYTTAQYRVFRNQNSGAFAFLDYASSTSYADKTYSTQGDFCYEINYTDMCKNDSPLGSIVCPIRLTGALDKMNNIHLTWNGYKGWKNGVSNYTIDKFDDHGTLLRSIAAGTDTFYVDNQNDTLNQIVSYKITAEPSDPLIASVSNVAAFTKEANLFSPTAFTPDHNNMNDMFTVRGFFITRLELRIFNRWGILIFYTNKNEAWDGTFNGKSQPNDTYVWTASITDKAGQNFSRSGTVVLLTKR